MPTHYSEPIIDYWEDEVNRGVKKAKFRKRRIFFRILFIAFNWVLYLSIPQDRFRHLWFIDVYDGCFIYFFVIFPVVVRLYVLSEENKMLSKFNAGKLINVSNQGMPDKLDFLHTELLQKFNIPVSAIVVWLDDGEKTCNINCNYFQKKYQLIISLGFLKLLKSDFESAKIIYAHEFCHIRQRDPLNVIYEKFNARVHLLFWRIPEILFNVFNMFILFNVPVAGLNDFGFIEYNIPAKNLDSIVSSCIYLVFQIHGAINYNKKAFDCERNADIGTSLLYGTEKLERCLKKYSSTLSFYKKILLKAPSLEWRLNELTTLKKYFPELGLISDDKMSLLPELEELK